MNFRSSMLLAVLLLSVATLAVSTADEEDASTVGCLPPHGAAAPQSACASCHADAGKRWQEHGSGPCTPYCSGCHKGEQLARHHAVGVALEGEPEGGLRLTGAGRIACFTCHDLSRSRYDGERWKAASLYERMFRAQPRYKTYFLVQRNDNGQLCLNCH